MIGQTPVSADAPTGVPGADAQHADAAPAAASASHADPASRPDPAPRPDPTRYGDWERNGRCIDF